MNRMGWEQRTAAVFTLVVVALRIWFARQVSFCGTPDSCYGVGMGRALASGHGFRLGFLFDLQVHAAHLPTTGLEYWRPGVALILQGLRLFGGVTLHRSLVVTVWFGVVWALVSWWIAMRATGSRRVALASYALCLLLPPGWESSLTPDPTLYYAAAVAWFLALFTVERQGLWQDVVALGCVGAAYLIRNDAGLLLAPLAAVLWLRMRQAGAARRRGEAAPAGSSGWYTAAMVVGFFVALGPMHLLYRHVLGTAFPAGTSKALFLNDMSDFSSYGAPVSLHTLLAHGVKHLIAARVNAVAMIVYRLLALVLGYAALVFLPSLVVTRRPSGSEVVRTGMDAARMPELAGPVAFGVVVLVVYGLVLPTVGTFSALRTAVGLLPVTAVIVVVAMVRLARSRRVAVALAGTVIAVYAVSGVMDDRREIGPMNAIGEADRAQAAELAAMGAEPENAVVMTADPVQFSVTTGYRAIPMPSNGLDAITKEALDLHASYAILDGEHLPGSPNVVAEKLHPTQTEAVPGQTMLVLELCPEPQRP
ncbi:MAG TPA: hypothetical protein VHY48_01060 [Acidobacteriaceae bacterium]|jgi:hypothetical protein|nr:hypothetical protein [Acidobacteriaceae bacterium]